jgi:hypothetical protein
MPIVKPKGSAGAVPLPVLVVQRERDEPTQVVAHPPSTRTFGLRDRQLSDYPCMSIPRKASNELTPDDRARMAAVANMERKGIQHFIDCAHRDGVALTNEFLDAALLNIMEEMRSRQHETDLLTAQVNTEAFESYEAILVGDDSMSEPDDSAENIINVGPAVGAYADFFHKPSTWEEMFQMAPNAGYSRDIIAFAKLLYPSSSITELTSIAMGLEQCPINCALRVPFEPIRDAHDSSKEGMKLKITWQVPADFGTAPGLDYFHGTNALVLPSVRYHGLRVSASGAGSTIPALYTCKNRSAPYHVYANCANTAFPMEVVENGRKVVREKSFRVLIGIGSLLGHPYHSKKVSRQNGRSQYLFFEGTYRPMWIEFIATTDLVFDRTLHNEDYGRFKAEGNRKEKALAMITPLLDSEVIQLGEAPPARQRHARHSLSWHDRNKIMK